MLFRTECESSSRVAPPRTPAAARPCLSARSARRRHHTRLAGSRIHPTAQFATAVAASNAGAVRVGRLTCSCAGPSTSQPASFKPSPSQRTFRTWKRWYSRHHYQAELVCAVHLAKDQRACRGFARGTFRMQTEGEAFLQPRTVVRL